MGKEERKGSEGPILLRARQRKLRRGQPDRPEKEPKQERDTAPRENHDCLRRPAYEGGKTPKSMNVLL
jgi:hypothetical protein